MDTVLHWEGYTEDMAIDAWQHASGRWSVTVQIDCFEARGQGSTLDEAIADYVRQRDALVRKLIGAEINAALGAMHGGATR